VKITLTREEVRLSVFMGKSRYACARSNGVLDAQIGDQDKAFIDINGFAGELAVCRALNVYPDLSVSPRQGSWDCEYEGSRIDVKTTHHLNGRLLVSPKKGADWTDIYVLVVGRMPDFEIKGWMMTASVFDRELRDLGHGLGYVVENKELHPFPSLVRELSVM